MKKTKKIISLLLIVVFAVTFVFNFATPASATATDVFDLWVGGVRADSSNASDILGDGTVNFDPVNNILTLTNANISNCYYFDQKAVSIYSTIVALQIRLVGNNTIDLDPTFTNLQDNMDIDLIGINASESAVTIKGDGNLSINVADYEKPENIINHVSNSYGIDSGNLTFDGSGTISITTGSADISTGIMCYGVELKINSGDITSISGATVSDSIGIQSFGDINITGGSLTAKSGVAGDDSFGIDSEGNITMENCILNATGGGANDSCYAILCGGKIMNIKSGTLNAECKNGETSFAIGGECEFIIDGGSVTVSSTATVASIGIFMSTITVNGGTLNVSAATDQNLGISVGIFTMDMLKCLDYYDGNIYMTGGTVAFLGTFNNLSTSGEVYCSEPYNDSLKNMVPAILGNYNGFIDGEDITEDIGMFFTDEAKTNIAKSVAIGKIYTITFNSNGGICDTATVRTIIDGTIKSLPTPTKTNYKFDGWYTLENGGSKVDTSAVFTADTTLYAHFTSTVPATGDTANLILYVVIMVVAGALCTIILIRRKRTQK